MSHNRNYEINANEDPKILKNWVLQKNLFSDVISQENTKSINKSQKSVPFVQINYSNNENDCFYTDFLEKIKQENKVMERRKSKRLSKKSKLSTIHKNEIEEIIDIKEGTPKSILHTDIDKKLKLMLDNEKDTILQPTNYDIISNKNDKKDRDFKRNFNSDIKDESNRIYCELIKLKESNEIGCKKEILEDKNKNMNLLCLNNNLLFPKSNSIRSVHSKLPPLNIEEDNRFITSDMINVNSKKCSTESIHSKISKISFKPELVVNNLNNKIKDDVIIINNDYNGNNLQHPIVQLSKLNNSNLEEKSKKRKSCGCLPFF